MIGALVYLWTRSLANLLRTRALRLRQPRYLIGAAVGILYFWFFFFRHIGPAGRFPDGSGGPIPDPTLFVFAAFAVLGLVRIAFAWLAPSPNPGLDFSEAEVAFLFPAPATRRQLVDFKLAGSQFTILISALILAFLRGRSGAEGNFLTHTVGWWVVLTLFNLHRIGASFTVARLVDGGVSRVRRQTAVVAVVVFFVAAVVWAVWRSAPDLESWLANWRQTHPGTKFGMEEALGYGQELATTGALRWVLLPFRLALMPLFAETGPSFLLALGPALALVAVHYWWVQRSAVSFEEASIVLAEKRAARVAALREGRHPLGSQPKTGRKPPFRLRPTGGPAELGFLWKNLLSTHAWLGPRALRAFAVPVLVFALVLPPPAFFVLAMIAIYVLLLGPQLARQDLRRDLRYAEILKSYPLPGWRIVLGELLAPTLILSGLLWLCLLGAGILIFRFPGSAGAPPIGFILLGGLEVVVAVPVVCLLQLLIPNAAAVLFPSWALAGRPSRGAGLEVFGQRLLFLAGQLLVIALALLPAVLIGVMVGFAVSLAGGPFLSAGVGALAVLLILAVEIVLGVLAVGRSLERLDLSQEHTV